MDSASAFICFATEGNFHIFKWTAVYKEILCCCLHSCIVEVSEMFMNFKSQSWKKCVLFCWPEACVYKGEYYTQGQTWYDGCDYFCTCEEAKEGIYRCIERSDWVLLLLTNTGSGSHSGALVAQWNVCMSAVSLLDTGLQCPGHGHPWGVLVPVPLRKLVPLSEGPWEEGISFLYIFI